MLQWDRAFDGAEISCGFLWANRVTFMLQRDRAFDGAEIQMFGVWRVSRSPLQWDRAFDGAEIGWIHSRCDAHSDASMGPRL